MKSINNKKLEMGIYIMIFALFVVTNMLLFRVFHVVPVLLMLICILIRIICITRSQYIEWNSTTKKTPSILGLVLPVVVYTLYSIIIKYVRLPDYIYVFCLLFSILMWIIIIRGFFVYLFRYNKLYLITKKEVKLAEGQILYNTSVAVINVIILILIWFVTGSLLDKIAIVDSTSKYNKELSYYLADDNQFGFFPESIPENATNLSFYSQRGLWLESPKLYLSFTTSNEYISSVENMYKEEVIEIDADILKDFNEKSEYDIYLEANNKTYGYAIDRASNQICFFYDSEAYRIGESTNTQY